MSKMTQELTHNFSVKLKQALTGSPESVFIYINNFEVEEQWNQDNTLKLPSISVGNSTEIVNRMEELGVFLAGQGDYVLLKEKPDPHLIADAQDIGFGYSLLLTMENNTPKLNITENILNCEATLKRLREIGEHGKVYLVPFGVSSKEEELSQRVGIPLAVPSSNVFQQVNDKGYSRRLNQQLGIRQIYGKECNTIDELKDGFNEMSHLLDQGNLIVMKDALGVSGKGITVISDRQRFDKVLKMLERQASKKGTRKINYVLEQWIDKICDLNYQFLIDRNGQVEFICVKESLVKQGVHQGHVMPSRLSNKQVQTLKESAEAIGMAMYKDGYFGMVGVDAILDLDGNLYPNLEINARFNMSTYQINIQNQLIGPGKWGLAKKYTMKLKDYLPYDKLKKMLSTLNYNQMKEQGLLINNFATVNAAFKEPGALFTGRLYGMLVADSLEALFELDASIESKLKEWEAEKH
ncbi:ATP-binding protein [Paenibacillus sp. An7]|uniref:ATP-binding protein n=1 Tax=Paenibacillus sp. An7 TaxID=2689577 RepID=UPI0013593904|nr:ATP-grasp domain-containing protein [Paenibacillus sp. An7]